MLVPGTMRLCNNAVLTLFLASAGLVLPAQTASLPAQAPAAPAGAQAKPLAAPAQDADPVRSPDVVTPTPPSAPLQKQGGGFLLHTDVEEVVLFATVLNGSELVENLNKDDFQVFEDGAKQTLISFQHTDLPVSIGLVVDNSGSMYRKRPSVNKSALDLIQASNPQDEAFVVNFSDEACIDAEFTSDVHKLRDGLAHIDSRGGTALYDAVVASADKLVADAKSDLLLGMHIVAPQAESLIGEGIMALEMGATLEDIGLSVHPHPTFTEGIMDAAEAAHGKAIHILNPKPKAPAGAKV